MLCGRDSERSRIGALLDGARQSRSGVLVLRGEPGIGKTALLDDTRARAQDMHVLTARGVEAEYELPFAGLHQLLRPALELLDQLPEPQAHALSGALGVRQPEASPERFLVFAGALSLLSELADRRPVLCLVDDAQWLDQGSADALRFVARRLAAEGVVMLFGVREGGERTFDAPDLPSLALVGLSPDDAADLLRRAARVAPAASVCERLVGESGGNALALLELTATLTGAQLAGEEPLPEMLRLTSQVESLFVDQVRQLPEETQRVLLLAAADEQESLAVVTRACRVAGIDPTALDAAEEGGFVTISGGLLTFRHPLVRSAVYGAAGSGERRAAHRALADAYGDDPTRLDDRAWHLAASVLGPDPEVIAALDEAAARAWHRSAHMASMRALERAVELAPDDPASAGRLVRASMCASVAGADERALQVARRAQTMPLDPVQKVQVARVFGLAGLRVGRPQEGVAMMVEAVRGCIAAEPDHALELALDVFWIANEADDAAAVGEVMALVDRAPAVGSGAGQFVLDLLGGLRQVSSGDPEGATALRNAVAWGEQAEDPRHPFLAGIGAIALGDDDAAAALTRRAADLSRAQGWLGTLVTALGTLGFQSMWSHRFDTAEIAATEVLGFARELRWPNAEAVAHVILGHTAAIRGDDEQAEELLGAAIAHARSVHHHIVAATAECGLAVLDMGRGRWTQALTRFTDLPTGHMSQVISRQSDPDHIEAAVRAGERARAVEALDRFATWSESADPPWTRPWIPACRALLADGDEATALYERAVAQIGDARPHDAARIHLLYGEHLRRMRRRTEAREHLRAALAGFEGLGSAPWADRASAELRATGETARKRDPSTVSQLTPQETLIARYVADGLSNKEVAARLFLSRRTVDYHLRNVYSKLNITSRMQLAGMPLGDTARAGDPAPA
jgi:DNA-binding CsgD family transcriptional regulator